jgi:wyosine [tRNA(Phe)-imidazoG37] synthetase (radical SAM superfamily)
MEKYKHLFGPVDSRRLGKSLGIDLLPFKTCSLDCVFCECGKTTCLTSKKQTFVSTDAVVRELKDFFTTNPDLNFVTFSGAGEPTLADNLGEIIGFIKDQYPQYKVCVLTNGTLFSDQKVRQRVLRADVLVPSLHAVTAEAFLKINRPVKDINVTHVIDGLIELRKEFTGQIWLEVFIVPGINDSIDEIMKLKKVVLEIKPDKIQLNSLDRLGTESWVTPASREELEKIAEALKPLAVEIVAKTKTYDGPRQGTRAQ